MAGHLRAGARSASLARNLRRVPVNDVLTQAEQYLDRVGLIDRPGAVLYSSHETLKPGPVYLLGLNPGGSEGATLKNSIEASRRGSNAYLDEEWAPGGHVQPRGQSTLQRRIQTLCRAMCVKTRDTPASNLAFTRSTGLAAHPGYGGGRLNSARRSTGSSWTPSNRVSS